MMSSPFYDLDRIYELLEHLEQELDLLKRINYACSPPSYRINEHLNNIIAIRIELLQEIEQTGYGQADIND